RENSVAFLLCVFSSFLVSISHACSLLARSSPPRHSLAASQASSHPSQTKPSQQALGFPLPGPCSPLCFLPLECRRMLSQPCTEQQQQNARGESETRAPCLLCLPPNSPDAPV